MSERSRNRTRFARLVCIVRAYGYNQGHSLRFAAKRGSAEMKEPPTLRVRLFDYWRLTDGHQEIEVPLRSQRLVALLALRGRQSRARLAGTLWPEVNEKRALASLRVAISVLHHLAPGLVEKDRGDVFLGDHVIVDISEFCVYADQVLSGRSPEPTAVDHPAVTGGELLPGWYDDWLFPEWERIHQLRLHILEALARCLIERGAQAHALQMALQAVAIDPLRESARRLVIQVHIAEGNIAEAIREYQRFRALLREELHVEPTGHMTELLRHIAESTADPDHRLEPHSEDASRRIRARSQGLLS